MGRSTYKSMEFKYKNLSFGEKALMENIVDDIEDKYGIVAEECLKYLCTLKKYTKKITRNPKIPLPFYGVVQGDKCQAIVLNHRLYTQCKFGISNGVYCGHHSKGRKYGVISDRLDSSWMPNGPKPLPYRKVLEKLNIDISVALRVINEMNINEEYLNANQ